MSTQKVKIKTGDTVMAIAGKDKGKTGKVLQVFPKEYRASVEGINMAVKHLRPRRNGEKGQKIQYPAPIHLSNLMIMDPKANKPSRIGYKILEDKSKVRILKKSKERI